jgi:hypothetical protein
MLGRSSGRRRKRNRNSDRNSDRNRNRNRCIVSLRRNNDHYSHTTVAFCVALAVAAAAGACG